MFLIYVFFIYLGVPVTKGDKNFARVGDRFAFSFNSQQETDICSISISNKTVILYDSDRNFTIGPDYRGRVVNMSQESLHFTLINLAVTDSGEYISNCTDPTEKVILQVIHPISTVTIQQTGPDPAVAGSNFSLVCDVKPAIHVVNVSWSFTNTLSIPSIPGEENFQFRGEFGEILMIKHVKECYRNVQIACVAMDVLNVKKSSNSYSLFVVVPPEVLLHEKTASAMIGRPFFTDCGVKGYPSPEVWWYLKDKRVPQFHLSESVSTLVIRNVTSVSSVNYTCTTKVSNGSFRLFANESFILQPYGLSVANQPFLGSNIYKYTMFGLSIFGASSLVLLLMIKVFSIAMKVRSSRKNSNNYGVLPETLKVGPVIEGRKTAERTDEKTDVGKESKIKQNSKETKQVQHNDYGYRQSISLYEDISEDFKSIPKLPTKSSEMKKVQSEPMISKGKMSDKNTGKKKDRCKKPKDSLKEDSNPRTVLAEPTLYEEMTLEQPGDLQITDPKQATGMKKIQSEPIIAKNQTSDKISGKKKDRYKKPKDSLKENSNPRTNLAEPTLYEEMSLDQPDDVQITDPINTSEMKKSKSETMISTAKNFDKNKEDRCKKPKGSLKENENRMPELAEPTLYEEMALEQPGQVHITDPIQETYTNTATVLLDLGYKTL
uniref:Uncharacterized protein LOC111123689 isoform X1 n=2 Tax=Crassostrea virginica TaxID=6565 RepID=A0A8B8D2B4_CRAVI|nr:uncharacterized protein LOC111123689 isoform X1 [Crassostrea virginica]